MREKDQKLQVYGRGPMRYMDLSRRRVNERAKPLKRRRVLIEEQENGCGGSDPSDVVYVVSNVKGREGRYGERSKINSPWHR